MLENIGYPKTKEQAEKCIYGGGHSLLANYNPLRCAWQVCERGIYWYTYPQCHRKNGHGVSKLYCKQHAKEIK